MNFYAFHLGLIVSIVLGQVDHGQDGNAARIRIWDETSKPEHSQQRYFHHGAICQTMKALPILRCLYGSDMVLLGVVIKTCRAVARTLIGVLFIHIFGFCPTDFF